VEEEEGKNENRKGKLGGFEWAMRDWDRRAVTAVTMAIPYRIETPFDPFGCGKLRHGQSQSPQLCDARPDP
jgi:hypothetical protein